MSRMAEQKGRKIWFTILIWILRLGLICEKETTFHLFKLQHIILTLDSITELIISLLWKNDYFLKVCLKGEGLRVMAVPH